MPNPLINIDSPALNRLAAATREAERSLPAARPTANPPSSESSGSGPAGRRFLHLAVDENVPFVTIAQAIADAGLRITNDGRGGLIVEDRVKG